MGIDQIEQVRMFRAVEAVVELHKACSPLGAPLLAPYGTFTALLSCLDRPSKCEQSCGALTGLDKKSLRESVIAACLRFAAVLRSHGNATGNEDMQADGRVSRAKLEAVPDEAFPGAAHNILCWMDRLSAGVLSDYRIEAAEVPGTYAALSSFSKFTDAERQAKVSNPFENEDGPRIVAALAEILQTMMDPAVEQLAVVHPHFYREYFAARIAVISEDGRTPPLVTAVDAPEALQPVVQTGVGVLPLEPPRDSRGIFGLYAQSA